MARRRAPDRARRRWGPPLAAVAMTAWLVAVLGSERVVDRTARADHSLRPLFRSLTGLPMWSGDRIAGLEWALAGKLATLLVGVALLAWLASSSAGSRMTAFLAGWATSVVSSAMAGLVFAAVGNVVHASGSDTGLVGTITEVNRGAVFGLYTGWLVGLAIAAVIVPAATAPASERSSRTDRAPKVRSYPGGTDRRQPPPQAQPQPQPQPAPAPVATWPTRPPMGTVLPNPAWTAAGLREETSRPQTSNH